MKKLLAILPLFFMFACSSDMKGDMDFPKSREQQEEERIGKLTGEDGLVIFGGKKKGTRATEGINVNSYLWRASLDLVHKMPLLSADPFGGTIITDWYKPEGSSERYKLTILIIGDELRSDAVKVSAFKQKHSGNAWVDMGGSEKLATEIEDKILLKARQIKFGSSE